MAFVLFRCANVSATADDNEKRLVFFVVGNRLEARNTIKPRGELLNAHNHVCPAPFSTCRCTVGSRRAASSLLCVITTTQRLRPSPCKIDDTASMPASS